MKKKDESVIWQAGISAEGTPVMNLFACNRSARKHYAKVDPMGIYSTAVKQEPLKKIIEGSVKMYMRGDEEFIPSYTPPKCVIKAELKAKKAKAKAA